MARKTVNIIVEGNIGCGKTTFLERFKKYEDVCCLPEPIDMWRNCMGHNLLGLLYEDINQWSFSFQSYAMLSMVQQHSSPTPCRFKIMERSIYSARFCFVELMKQDKLIPEPSAAVLDGWFNWFTGNTDVHVDLIVYLRSTPEVVYERMHRRNRREESSVSLDYLKSLHEVHEKWLNHKTIGICPAPVLTINADLDNSVCDEYEKYESHILGLEIDNVV